MSIKVRAFVLLIVSISVACKEISRSHKGQNIAVDKIVLTAPVLAPTKTSKAFRAETAKDFPSLMVIATDNVNGEKVVNAKETSEEAQPIYYVKKLNEQDNYRKRSKQTRSLLRRWP